MAIKDLDGLWPITHQTHQLYINIWKCVDALNEYSFENDYLKDNV